MLGRRSFLKLGGFSLLFSTIAMNIKHAFAYWDTPWKKRGIINYWQGPTDTKYFIHSTVNTCQIEQNYIWARVDGWWRRFTIREAEEKFINWWIKDATLPYEFGQLPRIGGAYMPIVATYGNFLGRGDSLFHLNCACKGAGIPPKKDYIKEINNEMKIRIVQPTEEKLAWLHEIIKDKTLWDYSKIVSIEIFTNPEFETHTFLNQMENPISTISFMNRIGGFEHFELRCIVKLLCSGNPYLNEDEKDLSEFANLFHIFWTPITSLDQYPIDLICAVYYIIEEFDNLPYTSCGIRLVPPYEYETDEVTLGENTDRIIQ